MADEFPTLEVALAACVLWLGFRSLAMARGAALLDADVNRLLSAIRRRAAAPGAQNSAWLEELGRAALAGGSESESESEAENATLRERARRVRRRLRSAAARDLVVCAVLIGAMAYARGAALGVGVWFFALGALACILLLGTVGLRLWHVAQVDPVSERLSHALGERSSEFPAPAADRVCAACGAGQTHRVSGRRNLGKRLTAFGVTDVVLCESCGHVSGHVVKR